MMTQAEQIAHDIVVALYEHNDRMGDRQLESDAADALSIAIAAAVDAVRETCARIAADHAAACLQTGQNYLPGSADRDSCFKQARTANVIAARIRGQRGP